MDRKFHTGGSPLKFARFLAALMVKLKNFAGHDSANWPTGSEKQTTSYLLQTYMTTPMMCILVDAAVHTHTVTYPYLFDAIQIPHRASCTVNSRLSGKELAAGVTSIQIRHRQGHPSCDDHASSIAHFL